MTDREKVIKGLEGCIKNIDQQDCPNDCPYLSDCSKYENRVIFQPLMRDALALLKEQEEHEKLLTKIGYHWTGSGETLALCRMKDGEQE